MSQEEIIMIIKSEMSVITKQDVDSIDEETNLLKIGISSIEALKLINRIKKKLNVDISPVALFEFKTISAFAGYLSECQEDAE